MGTTQIWCQQQYGDQLTIYRIAAVIATVYRVIYPYQTRLWEWKASLDSFSLWCFYVNQPLGDGVSYQGHSVVQVQLAHYVLAMPVYGLDADD